MNKSEWRSLTTEQQFDIYFKYMREHCSTCGSKLKDKKCTNKKWWKVFHWTSEDPTWTLFCN